MTLYAFNDTSRWGQQFKMAAAKRGIECVLLNEPFDNLHEGAKVFLRMDQQGNERSVSRMMAYHYGEQCKAKMLPSYAECQTYDDKLAQYPLLRPWLPRTVIEHRKGVAQEALKLFDFPLISKGSEGSSSKCVRLLRSKSEAYHEIDKAFGHGIPGPYRERTNQHGYIYLQEFIPHEQDYRVIVCGQYVWGLVRKVRNDPLKPFASGSGDNYPNTMSNYREIEAIRFGVNLADMLKTTWMAFDIVFDKDNKPRVLEMSCSWTPHAYAYCPVYRFVGNDIMPARVHPTGASMFDIAVEILADPEDYPVKDVSEQTLEYARKLAW